MRQGLAHSARGANRTEDFFLLTTIQPIHRYRRDRAYSNTDVLFNFITRSGFLWRSLNIQILSVVT